MTPDSRDSYSRTASFVLAGLALAAVLMLHLLVPLLAGLLVYELVLSFTPLAQRTLSTRLGKLIVVTLFSALVITGLVGAVVALVAFFRSDTGDLAHLLEKISGILDRVRGDIPAALAGYLPEDVGDLKTRVVSWLRGHIAELQMVGTHTLLVLVETLVALVIAAIISLREVDATAQRGPLGHHLVMRASRFARAFHQVALSQISIALLNTTFTSIYLVVALPLFGVHLPLVKTMIACTFVLSLLPVVGNLMSNSIIVLVSLGNSTSVAIASLVFLISIHKFEYFLNARIVGSRINAAAWELLIAMMVMEAMFGVSGLVAAPIFYAYLKSELMEAKLI
jgi:predicted PurR-regulated permease PerM